MGRITGEATYISADFIFLRFDSFSRSEYTLFLIQGQLFLRPLRKLKRPTRETKLRHLMDGMTKREKKIGFSK